MKRIKTFLVLILSVLLIVSALPMSVSAADDEILINGVDITKDDDYTLECGGGTAVYDPNTKTLTLTNATIENELDPDGSIVDGIIANIDFKIILVGENKIDVAGKGIYMDNVQNDLSITGDGKLTINCKPTNRAGHMPDAVGAKNLTVDGVTLDITTTTEEDNSGLQVNGSLKITNSDISINASSFCIAAPTIDITNSTLRLNAVYSAISTDKYLHIDSSDVTAVSKQDVAIIKWYSDKIDDKINIINSELTAQGGILSESGDIVISGSEVSSSSDSLYPAIYVIDGALTIEENSNVTASISSDAYAVLSKSISVADSTLNLIRNNGSAPTASADSFDAANSIVMSTDIIDAETKTIADSIIFESSVGTVCGNAVIGQDFTLDTGYSLSIPNDQKLTIDTGSNFTVEGDFDIEGLLQINKGGVFYNYGDTTLSGSIINNGTIICTNHIGGEATYDSPAICDICGQPYGEKLDAPIIIIYNLTVLESEHGSAELSTTVASPGAKVYITVTPDEGCELSDLIAVDGSGKALTLTPEDGRFSFTMPNSNVTVAAEFVEPIPEPEPEPEPVELPFDDVLESDWYYEDVYYVYINKLMNGVAANLFAPNEPLTRAMTVTILSRLDGVESLEGDDWYVNGANWAVENGISDGTMLDANVTREQLVTMLYRYAQYKDYYTDYTEQLWAYPDASDVSDWAVEAFNWAIDKGIISGRDNGELDPQGEATRAEAAAIIARFYRLGSTPMPLDTNK